MRGEGVRMWGSEGGGKLTSMTLILVMNKRGEGRGV